MAGTGTIRFLPGDVLFFESKGDVPGHLGKWIARSRGERSTYSVHTAQFLDAGTILEMNYVVMKRNFRQVLKARRGFEVWRYRSLTDEQRRALTQQALAYFEMKFGWAKLLTHALDGLINKLARKEFFLFRRLNNSHRYPVCSWITAFSYDRALNYRFGIPPECADPDEMHDWVTAHPGEWELVFRHTPRKRIANSARRRVAARISSGLAASRGHRTG
jgi:hypothetical protein